MIKGDSAFIERASSSPRKPWERRPNLVVLSKAKAQQKASMGTSINKTKASYKSGPSGYKAEYKSSLQPFFLSIFYLMIDSKVLEYAGK